MRLSVSARAGTTLVAVLATTSLALSACGGGDDEEPTDDTSVAGAPRAEQSDVPPTWPLTGLPADDGASATDHPVLVLKMDNTSASAPQQGLGEADMVVEELVEGGSTRLAVFYYTDIPGKVGPVRSMRASDIGIVKPVDATMVTSGAAAQTIKRLKKADVPFQNESSPGFYRDDSRSAPYNLFTDMGKVADAVKLEEPARPPDYLPFGDADAEAQGREAATLTAQFSGSHSTSWRFEDDGYVNVDSFAPDDDQFPADSVLVLRVKVGDAGYVDPAGNPVPETKFVGKGEAMLFHGGRLVRGEWSKETEDSPLELRTDAGPLTVPAGHTWIELVPRDADGGSVEFAE
ncbi:hypothetical protein GCM10023340_17450 [Nocardioides marinquilinus]|uniref:DUF3048 domain-containing protein n=1 Tax=Nocardioides marinquilinus TaxID=1210400 RepID=A0ABP9PH35_9ACTN